MSNNNDSTLKSYIDSATGTVQSAFGSVMGSTGDKAQGDQKQDKAQVEHDVSHATAKVPGATISSSGVAKDNPDRNAGSWNQTVGSAKEAVGGFIGSESLKQTGRQQNQSGQEQEARGQASDFVSGASDRLAGTLGNAAAALTGDRSKQEEYQNQHDTGKTLQRGAEHDIQKQANAANRDRTDRAE